MSRIFMQDLQVGGIQDEMGDESSTHDKLTQNFSWKTYMGNVGVDGRTILKLILKNVHE
jgi:hypothetical protein